MRKLGVVLLALFAMCNMTEAETIKIANFDNVNVNVPESDPNRTVVTLEIGSFDMTPVMIQGETYLNLALDHEGVMHEKGNPALPRVCRSIIIPDDTRMRLNILKTEYTDFEGIQVAPSKGHIKRKIDPQTVPYEFDNIYRTDIWFPEDQALIREPYILRDLRGTVIEFYPFQYNPVLKTLRVYTSITVEVVADGIGQVNVLNRARSFDTVDPAFAQLYENHFINYNTGALLYNPLPEAGDMLIIAYDSFVDEMMPFVEWKNQKGIKTTIVSVSTIGNYASSIKDFIQDFYDSTDLAWVLLVGDAAEVRSPYYSGGSSDPSYSKVAGGDNYPDIIVGRFSAQIESHVETQVTRTINYEKYPDPSATWYNLATGIASDEGPGHYGEYDYDHMNNIRTDLLGYNYTSVDQIYDPGATSAMVANAVNTGRGFINYIGHGSINSWGTTDFDNNNVNALTNDGKLPFIFSVACDNGIFDGNTCFGETWLRATNNSTGNPTGAMGAYMSSISQDWDPPMFAQDEANDLLISESSLTFGGICFNSACYMIDVEYSTGVEHCDTWIIFGDPSVMMITDDLETMAVTHDNSIIYNATSFSVNTGADNALCALYYDGILYGSAYADNSGLATINLNDELPIGATIILTVTAYNKNPYFAGILAISPEGAYVVYNSHVIDDFLGNNNGMADLGETISLDMTLRNIGPEDATDVIAVLSTNDPLVTITDSSETFGTVPGNFNSVTVTDAYGLTISPDIPDSHAILFHLEITGISSEIWESYFSIYAHAPILNLIDITVDDNAGGNGDGILEANETADIILNLHNSGSGDCHLLTGVLSETDSYITVSDPDGSFGDIAPGANGNNESDKFTVVASSVFPQGHIAQFSLALSADRGYSANLEFGLKSTESFESNNGGFSGQGVWQWGEPTFGPDGAYYGLKLWATILDNNYTPSANDDLISPEYHIYSDEAVLEFYHWYDIEDYWDGGNVKISTNGGSSWELITPDGDYPHNSVYSLGEPGYTNTSDGWQVVHFDLGVYVGEDVKIKWHFACDEYVFAPGWYIDDVSIINNIPLIPAVTFNLDEIADTLEQSEQIPVELIAANSGNANLELELSTTNDWLTFDSGPYVIEPSGVDTITIILDAGSLEVGQYNGQIAIESNIPGEESFEIPVSLTVISSYECFYVPGDINSDGQVVGADITYGINYFRRVGNPPPDSCYNEGEETWLYVAGDANGDCRFIGSDITYLVSYFRGLVDSPRYCQSMPPSNLNTAVVTPGVINKTGLGKSSK